MSKVNRIIVMAIAVGLVAVGVAPRSFAQTEIRVLDHEGPYEKQIDVGRAGFGPGDQILGTHRLYDAADPTAVVGRDFERIQVLRLVAGGQDFDFVYDTTIRLVGGDIVAYGEGRYSDVFGEGGSTISVVGGTGVYDGATGTLSVEATDTEGEFLITIALSAP